MKKEQTEQGFTLVEMLVVVLIIGILAGIALPQYRVAVMKAKVASMLPLMRAWKDAYIEWKLVHGAYDEGGSDDGYPVASELGVNWPNDWECNSTFTDCSNDEWYCYGNPDGMGTVECQSSTFVLSMFQADSGNSCGMDAESFANKIICQPVDSSDLGKKVCANMGRLVEGCTSDYVIGG